MSKQTKQVGFTTVEAMITLIVATIFVISFNMLYVALLQSTSMTKHRDIANDLAYTYLRKYAYDGASTAWFTCDATVGTGNTNDLTQNPNAAGQVVLSGTLTSDATKLPPPVTYQVPAHAPFGCSGVNNTAPLRVSAKVTYGPNNLSVNHATYVEVE